MQITSKHLSDTNVELTIVATQADLDPIKTATLEKLRPQVKLAGFRNGKAPLSMIEKSVDQNLLQSEFLETAIGQLYVMALSQEKLRPVTQPQVDLKKFVPFTTLEVVLGVDVLGEMKLPDYKKISAKKAAVSVAAKDVNDVLDNLRTRVAEKKEVKRAAKAGDEATIDFKGIDEKNQEPVNGAEGKDYPLVLGSNSFIPGFEDNVIGMKPGEEKTFSINFPEDYGVKALQKRAVSFTVTVQKLAELVKPKADDAFAATVGPFKTLDELKEDIKKQLTQEREQQAEREFENEIITSLAEKTTVALPKAIVDEELESLERDERQNLMYRGQTWEEHLAEEGVTEEEHREKNRQPAEERVKAGLMLAEIADKENVEVTEAELNERMEQLRAQYNDEKMRAELDKPENRRSISSRLLTEKTITLLKTFVK